MPYVFVKVKGGLGNQLFQYAIGEYLEAKLGKKVIYDVSDYDSKSSRELKLSELGIENHRLIRSKILSKIFWMLMRIIFRPMIHLEKKYGEIPRSNMLGRYFGFKGYYQTTDFVEPIKEKLVRNTVPTSNAEFEGEIAIHMRRGDYTSAKNMKIHGVCSDEFYLDAIRIMKDRGFKKFRVYSDDIVYAKSILQLDESITFGSMSGSNYDFDEFIELAQHRSGLIISNSSFSWWSAIISDSDNVIYPSKWFQDPVLQEGAAGFRVPRWTAL